MTSEEKQYFDDLVQRLSSESDTKIEKLKKEGNTETTKLITKLRKESKKEMEHYIGGLMEQYKWDLAAIPENTKGTPAMYEKVEMMFKNMGRQEIDIAILKEAARNHREKFKQLGV